MCKTMKYSRQRICLLVEVRHHLQLWNGRAFSELLRNPRVLIRAQEEVRQVFSGTGYVDEVDLQELKFLKEVIKETLRMHNTSRNTILEFGLSVVEFSSNTGFRGDWIPYGNMIGRCNKVATIKVSMTSKNP
ncbi:cytochrome P450 family protein [Medicago truncatula]|uniref:Cytochrome P450 family protein n=1 Tax=Medicago truncatula TaxID=3880 RepID=A0A072TXK1_MEDTR|nr:cytochrome P450 family protein [Medicago truncatula]